jgi:hypothetical protein
MAVEDEAPSAVDEYGGDFNDPSQRCRHGTFIGTWSGPDYMCGWCESGEEPEPEPAVPVCEWADEYTDYDGTHESAPCCEPARHTLVTEDAQGLENFIFCSRHAISALEEHVLDEDGTVWMDETKTARFITAHIGKVIQP